MGVVTTECTARLATMNDVEAIVAFYEQRRTQAVYLRKVHEIEQSIRNELFLLVKNNNNEIIAASGIYLLNDGKELEQCIVTENSIQRGTVAELGSVLRWRDGLPQDKQVEGVWHPLLFGVPMVLLFHRMYIKNGISIDTLVCDVQKDLEGNQKRLTGNTELTPLRWQFIEAGKDLLSAFKGSVRDDDPNVHREKDFFQGMVGNLPRVAKYLLNVAKDGLKNKVGQTLSVDLSPLMDHWALNDKGGKPLSDANGKPITILNQLVEHREAIEGKYVAAMGWREFARLFPQILTHSAADIAKKFADAAQKDMTDRSSASRVVAGTLFVGGFTDLGCGQ